MEDTTVSNSTAADAFTIPHSVQTSVDVSPLKGSRIFLDICAGAGYPLTEAMLQHECICFPVDMLIDAKMDLLDNSFFEPLLRICSSGMVGYGAAAPNCGEYSRLKLRDGGPPALRTPTFLDGLPNLNPKDLEKVQSSHTLMARSVLCLELIFAAGGHGHLEQPTNSMAWLEPIVRRFIKFCALFLVNFPACSYNRNWYKSWLLACTYPAMKSLGSKCQHPAGTHEQIAGARTAEGVYKSRATAEYPTEMCQAIAGLIAPLCSPSQRCLLDLDAAQAHIPIKQLHELPVSYEDGGGLFSEPDWSRPHRSVPDCFHDLRQQWVQIVLKNGLANKLKTFFASGDVQPPFNEQDIQPFKQSLSEFIQKHDMIPDWSIRSDQPMHLEIMAALSRIMGDKDSTLFPMLREGAPTGFDNDIPPSGCFPIAEDKTDDSIPLSIHQTNWQSAESDLPTTRELVDQELQKGWIFKYQGSLEDAQAEFGTKLAIGRLGLATSDHRPPRLVVDSSICGVNSRCHIPERTTLPSAQDVMRVFPLRNTSDPLVGFSFDIKSAHKLVVIKETDRGLLGFTLDNDIYFYKVAPFGATFSAYHWTRMGSFILRCIHFLLWWSHAGFIYVDDFFFLFPKSVAWIMACICCIFAQVLNIPISWRKTEFGPRVQWIGWQFHITAGYISLPTNKIDKLSEYISSMLRSSRTSKKSLEKLVGLLNWIKHIFIDALLAPGPLPGFISYSCKSLQYRSGSLETRD